MANYKITVEALNPDVDVAEELRNGIECDGFFMVGHTKKDEKSSSDTVTIYDMTTIDLACTIAKSTELLEAAMIAHGMEEARRMKQDRDKAKAPELLKHAAKDD